MREIKPIPIERFNEFVELQFNAYPGFGPLPTEDERKKVLERLTKRLDDPRVALWGSFKNDRLLGGLWLYDYEMNFHGARVLSGGGGSLGVDLMHKRDHIAKELMQFYFRHYREKNAPFAMLWPFRPDFYRQMGAGIGTRVNVYNVATADLPRGSTKENVRFLTVDDAEALCESYNRLADRTHGMVWETPQGWRGIFDHHKKDKFVGRVVDGRIDGYMMFSFVRGHPDNFVDNHIKVTEIAYETPQALSELLTFLHSQADQIGRVIFHTQDDQFYHCLRDPRNDSGVLHAPVYHETNRSGVGIMYRALDTTVVFEALKDRDFGGQTLRLKLTVVDTFLPENDGSQILSFERGKMSFEEIDAPYDVEVQLDVAEFSALIVGSVSLKNLWTYGLAEISDETKVASLNRLFACDYRPVCFTDF